MIPFSPPRIDQLIIDEVVSTLKSGWITTGPKTRLFEKKITDYCNNKATLCVNSGTSGLEIMLRWYGVGPGDEVILPAYTYCATANVIIHVGAKPVFVDVNKNDFNISIKEIEKAITTKTKVIIPVDFGGFPCDYNGINDLVSRDDVVNLFTPNNSIQKKLGRILVLSDSAHSMGAEYYGKKAGSLTDVSVFSFHAVKNLTTGEGGAISLNLQEPFDNESIYKYLSVYTLHGQSSDAYSKKEYGKWRYNVVDAGYKANMTDILASIGLVEIDRYENDTLVKFRSIFDKYSEALIKYPWAEIPVYDSPNKRSSCHLYSLRIKNINEQQRDEIIQEIFNRGVSVNVHFVPVPMFSFYQNIKYDIKNYPISYDNYSREITLPTFYDITDDQIEKVIASVVESVELVIKG